MSGRKNSLLYGSCIRKCGRDTCKEDGICPACWEKENPPPPIPAPEGEVPPRIFLRDVDLRDLDFDGAEGDVHATHSPRSIIITHSTPYVPESALLAEKQRGLRAVEEATKLKEQNIRLRAEMTELLEAIRLSPIAPDDRTDEARLSCTNYLKHIREQEAKARAAKEQS